MQLTLPKELNSIISKYNELVEKNNSSDLKARQEIARNMLRHDLIDQYLKEGKYFEKKNIKDKCEADYKTIKEQLDAKSDTINKKKKSILDLEKEIHELTAKTKSESKLAEDINNLLKLYVNFSLEHYAERENQGFYRVKCNKTLEYRNVTELSTGEKNIIAFLYFLGKIEETDASRDILPKLIVFDDPMTSNDDTMQYLIIEGINNLIKKYNDDSKIVIMTHNTHFYINITYNRCKYDKNLFIRLLSNGETICIKKITNQEDDIKTSYKALWLDLKFLYSNDKASEYMLLNPIRRIIETYTNFNCIDKNDFLNSVPGTQKLFNVNSHSIDDLEADLSGKSKDEIMNLMRSCFEHANILSHFNKFWDYKEIE